MQRNSRPPWTQPGWLDEVVPWIEAALARHGRALRGQPDPFHLRPWSAVLRAPATGGDVYFKATLPLLRHEVALNRALARWQPDVVLPLLAADEQRGWMLLPDGGTPLRAVIRASKEYRHWEGILPRYAALQRELVARVPALLKLGVPDRRLAALPAAYERLLADREMLRVDQEDGVTGNEYRRLQAMTARLPALCAELAGYGIPETLHHGDFHDGNVFVGGDGDGRLAFFDWGDSAVAHPFYSLRSTFVSLEYSLDLPEGAPEMAALRDVYLEAWADVAPRAMLRAAFDLAQPLAAVNGALIWHRILAPQDAATRAEYARPVPGLLLEFLALAE